MEKTEITFTIRVSKRMWFFLGIVIEFSLYTFHIFPPLTCSMWQFLIQFVVLHRGKGQFFLKLKHGFGTRDGRQIN